MRPIDAERLLEERRVKLYYHLPNGDIAIPIIDIEHAPTIEQPEIIRCKDCKYAEIADKEDAQDGYTCQFHRGSIWFSGSYCSWAERRDENVNADTR